MKDKNKRTPSSLLSPTVIGNWLDEKSPFKLPDNILEDWKNGQRNEPELNKKKTASKSRSRPSKSRRKSENPSRIGSYFPPGIKPMYGIAIQDPETAKQESRVRKENKRNNEIKIANMNRDIDKRNALLGRSRSRTLNKTSLRKLNKSWVSYINPISWFGGKKTRKNKQ